MIGGGMTPILASGFNAVATTYDVTYERVALTTGLFMMGLGIGSVVMSPTAILWGKRPVYLASSILFLLSAVWCALSPNFASLAVARIFQGLAVSPVECLPSATIAEIFFLHERAYRVGIYSLLLLGGKNLVPLVSAVIIQAKGWRFVFWVIAIAVGFSALALFFMVPETFWDRTPRPKSRSRAASFRRNIRESIGHHERRDEKESPSAASDSGRNSAETRRALDSTAVEDDDAPPKAIRYTTGLRNAPPRTYVSSLKVWNGRLSTMSWLRVAIRPFILFAYPSVFWSALVYSLSVGWLIVLSESVSHVYSNKDSYNFTPLQVGLVYLSPFVGGVLGTAVAGKGSDYVVHWLSRRNRGVYEPEFRLIMGIPIALTTAAGLMGFGWAAEETDRWIVPTIFFGVISFGCSLGATTAITFCVDSYRQFAGEALVTLNFSKNIFHGLVFSLFFPKWLTHDGSKEVFTIIGCIQLACLLFTIPMYIYGKRARMWTVRKGFMDRFLASEA